MSSELSRLVRIDTLGSEPREMTIEADAAERKALAARFDLISIHRLDAELKLVRTPDAVKATGRMKAQVDQPCVATGEAVPATLNEEIDILFRPQPETAPDEEIELGEEELDVVFYDGALIDAGEAVAESLSLALDPYPRSPAADAALGEAGVIGEEEAREAFGPFSGLAGLRDKLNG